MSIVRFKPKARYHSPRNEFPRIAAATFLGAVLVAGWSARDALWAAVSPSCQVKGNISQGREPATIAARDDELIGERWHADEAARQRDVAKAALTAAEAERDRLIAEEREACAKLAEKVGSCANTSGRGHADERFAEDIADGIRARSAAARGEKTTDAASAPDLP